MDILPYLCEKTHPSLREGWGTLQFGDRASLQHNAYLATLRRTVESNPSGDEAQMSKQPHHNQGSESMSGGNSGRRTGAGPQAQSGAGGGKKTQVGRKKSATKPQNKAA